VSEFARFLLTTLSVPYDPEIEGHQTNSRMKSGTQRVHPWHFCCLKTEVLQYVRTVFSLFSRLKIRLIIVIFAVLDEVPKGVQNMNSIPAQELKRRGIAAVDDLIDKGDVHVIRNNEPQYVVLSEARYQELVAEANEAYLARVRASLEDVKAGRVKHFKTADELLKALEAGEQE
jgi:PHD/YefM family antitoxin component YafN of YafNO toxin-antitoxin module